MFKFPRFIDGLLLSILAITGLFISLADLFDVLRFVGDRLPMLTFLVLSLAIASISSIQNKCIEMHTDVQHLLVDIGLEKMRTEVVEQIDLNLRNVVGDDYFLDILNFLQVAVGESNIHVNDWIRFRHYYVRTFLLCPKATFLSVSTSITGHLWSDVMIEEALTRFIKGGGRIKQVFFLKDKQELALPEVQIVLARLKTIGLQISVVFNGSTPNELKKNFMVESKGKIGWEMDLDSEGSVTTSIVTTNRQKIAGYRKMFDKLHGIDPHKLGAI